MKKILCILFLTVFIFTLAGCAKLIDTKTEVVEVVIIDIDYDPPRIMWSGKFSVYHPSDYDIQLKYGDFEEWVDISRSEYEKYKNLVDTTIKVNLITNYYDDDTTTQHFKLIQEK